LHDRHFSAASSFQIGVSRGRPDRVERNAGARLTAVAFDFEIVARRIEKEDA